MNRSYNKGSNDVTCQREFMFSNYFGGREVKGELEKESICIFDVFIENSISAHMNGDGLAFATIDKVSGLVVGSTRFMKANFPNKRVEIGFTFIAKSYQKTMIYTEAKLLMLTHAFEIMRLNRVEFLTDYLNDTSRNAILRLGAKEEGILRNHVVMPDGRVRDSVLFSITNNEWGGVKQKLSYKLASKY